MREAECIKDTLKRIFIHRLTQIRADEIFTHKLKKEFEKTNPIHPPMAESSKYQTLNSKQDEDETAQTKPIRSLEAGNFES